VEVNLEDLHLQLAARIFDLENRANESNQRHQIPIYYAEAMLSKTYDAHALGELVAKKTHSAPPALQLRKRTKRRLGSLCQLESARIVAESITMYEKEMEKKDQSTASLIYHYTSQQAALKILESQSFWFTYIGHLNDPLEHNWYFKRALDLNAQTSISWVEAEAVRRNIHKELLIKLNYMSKNDHYSDETSIFIASFSSVDDQLSQWIQYADKGMGVSLGFDEDAIKNWTNTIPRSVNRAAFVNYDIQKTDQVIKSSTEYSGLEGVFHKTNFWANEKEFRIALSGVGYTDYQFRTANATLVSYVSHSFINIWDAIKEVRLGPLVSPQSYFSWSVLLSKYCHGSYHRKIDLLKSNISLRIG